MRCPKNVECVLITLFLLSRSKGVDGGLYLPTQTRDDRVRNLLVCNSEITRERREIIESEDR